MDTNLRPFGHNTPLTAAREVRKRTTLKHGFQGQHRSNVKTDLNSQLMVSYLLPIHYGLLSLTVWAQMRFIVVS